MATKKITTLAYENEDAENVSIYEKRGYRTIPIFFVNGSRVSEDNARKARSNQTLLSFLRDDLLLTGSKLGCAEGGCGACTVMISKKDKETGQVKHFSANACLMPVLAADGCHVTTVEGVGKVKGNNLHPVQSAMVEMHGSQCGFCTPGIIVSIYSLLANKASVEHIEEHLDGNLCRCTGYRPIWDAARALCDDAEELVSGPCGTPCRQCPERDTCQQECNTLDKKAEKEMNGTNGKEEFCCSSSKDKVMKYKDFLSTKDGKWMDQPNAMFPKELLEEKSVVNIELSKPLVVVDRSQFHLNGTWFKPTNFEELLTLMKEFATKGCAAKIVVGNTEVGIETRFKHAVYPRIISPSDSIDPLFGLEVSPTDIVIGSCCPLSSIQNRCETLGKEQPSLSRTVLPIHDMLRWFASTQIRNVACLGGNLVTASPISDMNPLLACMGAKLVLSSLAVDGISISRRHLAVSDFFLKYRTVDLKPSEVVERVEVPILQKFFEYVMPFKQARRREDDISIVTSGMRIRLAVKDDHYIIEQFAMAFGGMAPTTILAPKTAQAVAGSEFCMSTVERAVDFLLEELRLQESVPGGQAAYRMTLAASFMRKFFISVVGELQRDIDSIQSSPSDLTAVGGKLPVAPDVDEKELTATSNFLSRQKPSFSGVQRYPAPKVANGLENKTLAQPKSEGSRTVDSVGKPVTHMSGPLHCTGEAVYTDDIPLPPQTLQAALILADKCGAVFESIDTKPALNIPGVVGVYTHEDLLLLGGNNAMGPIVHDEVLFLPVGGKIGTVGQLLGIVVAETLESAELGARAVEVAYGEVEGKVPVTVEDAIKAKSFYDFWSHEIERGDSEVIKGLATTVDTTGTPNIGDTVKVSGTFRSGAQDHFYLETNSTLAVPSESDTNLTIYCSTQAPSKTQNYCASTTGTPANKVVVRMKRMGGGFGGKETRSVFLSCAAAVAAKTSGRPVRLTIARDVDMSITGTRHVFVSEYCASAKITESGAKLVALEMKLYVNGGSGFDLTGPVNDRALFHSDNCYYFPHFKAKGFICKTVQAPHTAFRGFGGPQGMAAVEHVMEHLAVACNVPYDDIRRSNMYKVGDATPFGMVMGENFSGKWNVPDMWDRLYNELGISKRRAEAELFNSKNKWIKRGLSFIPTKFGIAFTAKFMNQGGALVHLYTDGTVLVSHGGTEMGQGLHTKVCQVAAQAFGIPVEDVYVNDSSTDKVANTIATAASMSTDMYGMATLDACRQIMSRLEPVSEKLGPEASLAEVASAAFNDRIDLSAHGFYAVDSSRCGYDWDAARPDDLPSDAPANSWKGHPFNYFTQGVAFVEVEVDLLTGNHRTLRSDLLIDVGSSINPTIDIGQVEGAFIQGMGWSTIEEVIYADDDHTWIRPRGKLFTTGPGTYKIPAFNDIPEIFNVSLLENVENPFAVHSSKAIGEPPFFLGASVFYAIKEAVRAGRKDQLKDDVYFEMRMPATSERIRMYGADGIASKSVSRMFDGETPLDPPQCYQPQGSY